MSSFKPPAPRDVIDFRFKKLRNIRIFDCNRGIGADKALNLLAVSNKYGLVFVATLDGVSVIRTVDIEELDEDRSLSRVEAVEYPSLLIRVDVTPFHVVLGCDDVTLAVCVIRDGCPRAELFDIRCLAEQNRLIESFTTIALSSKPGSDLADLRWNPVAPNMLAALLSDGSVTVYEIGEAMLKIYGTLPSTTSATAICWSPKGKQLAVGKADGSLTQYLPTLQEAKCIPAPPTFESAPSVVSLEWLSSFQFAVTYSVDNLPNLVLVTASKGKPPLYASFDDVCYGSSDRQRLRYFTVHLADWGVVLCASTNAIEVGVLAARHNDAHSWEHWIVEDSGRAELPLISNEETFPLGMALDLTSQKRILINDTDFVSPKPILHLLSTGGVLCSFYVIDERAGAPSFNRIPERLSSDGARHPVKPAESKANVEETTERNASFFGPGRGRGRGFSPQGGVCGIATGKSGSITSGTPVVGTSFPNATSTVMSFSQFESRNSAVQSSCRASAIDFDGSARPRPQKSPRKGASQNSLIAELNEEIRRFGAEVASRRLAPTEFKLGDDNELRSMAASVAELFAFAEEAKKATRSLNLDVHALRGRTLETVGAVEEARSLKRRTGEMKFVRLLRTRGLDPLSVKKGQEIRTLFFYVESQLRDANAVLDKQWEEYETSVKCDPKERSGKLFLSDRLPSCEMIRRTVAANRNTMLNLEQQIDDVAKRISRIKRFGARPRPTETRDSHDTIWSVGRKPTTRAAPARVPPTSSDGKATTALARRSLTPSSSARLKDLLSKRQVIHIRLPPSTCDDAFSRLLSSAAAVHDDEQTSDVVENSTSVPLTGVASVPHVTIHKTVPTDAVRPLPPSYTATPAAPNIFTVAAASNPNGRAFSDIGFGSFKLGARIEPATTSAAAVSPTSRTKKSPAASPFSYPMPTQGFNFGESPVASAFKFDSSQPLAKPVPSVFGALPATAAAKFCFSTVNVSDPIVVEATKTKEFHEDVTCTVSDDSATVTYEEEEEEARYEVVDGEETEAENEEEEEEQATVEEDDEEEEEENDDYVEGDDEAELLEEPSTSITLSITGSAVSSDPSASLVPAVPQMVSQLTSIMTQSDVAKPAPVLASLLATNKSLTLAVSAPSAFGHNRPPPAASVGASISPQSSATPAFAQSAGSGFTALFGSASEATATVSSAPFRFVTTEATSQVQSFSFTLPSSTTTATSSGITATAFGSAPGSFAAAATFGLEKPVFGKPIEAAKVDAPSLFGSRFSFAQNPATTAASTPDSTSAFAGKSVFGTQPAIASGAPVFSFGQSGTSAFSPNQASTFGSQTKVAFGQPATSPSFGTTPSTQGSSFGQSSTATGNIFGQTSGGFFGGLGGKPDPANANRNTFGGSATFDTSSQSTSLFGAAASTAGGCGSLWSKPAGSTGSFSTGAAAGGVGHAGFGGFQQSTIKTSGFGGSPAFGSSPTFGAVPSFGGVGHASGWVFGSQAPPTQAVAGFGSFARTGDTVSFGALATQGSSAATFGTAAPQNVPANPAFGSVDPNASFGGSAPVFGASSGSAASFSSTGSLQSFSQWRS